MKQSKKKKLEKSLLPKKVPSQTKQRKMFMENNEFLKRQRKVRKCSQSLLSSFTLKYN